MWRSMIKHKMLIIYLAATISVVSAGLYILFFIIIAPAQEAHFRRHCAEKLRTAAENRSSQIAQALAAGDDIAILRAAREITADPGMLYVRIISTGGVILAHSDFNENLKPASDTAGRLAAASTKPLLQRIPGGYDYSLPLAAGEKRLANLSIGLSDVSVQTLMKTQRAFYLKAAAAFLMFILIAGFLIFHIIVIRPLKKFRDSLENVLIGGLSDRLPPPSEDEIGRAAKLVNRILDRTN